jgi:proteasome lid subunit RPN8/RPN11
VVDIFMQRDVLTRLTAFIITNGSVTREIGGVLAGAVYHHPGREGLWVDIEDFIPAEQTEASAVSLRFTHETWQQIQADKATRFGDEKLIVGWYHTHPAKLRVGLKSQNLKHFLSTDDITVHHDTFSERWQVAMVTDPRCSVITFFAWHDGTLIEVPCNVWD